jgi:hypothetical protein
MSKNKKFVGQPILSQILSCVSTSLIKQSAQKHNSNRYYKRIPVRVHLVSLLYGVFSYCNGLREICEGMLACEGKLAHLGLDKAPPRSTLSDANTRRSYLVFETIYFKLLKQYHSFISDSRLKGLSIRNLKIIDSTSYTRKMDLVEATHSSHRCSRSS